ncbi:MAG: VWA domain-containing protein [Betaproteobacteria bacterium]|nr:VWA domain-containing protein [Betaproteobacteria bacterium]
MTDCLPPLPDRANGGWIARLARDRAGNTLAMIAAAIAPIMAMVGGGVDMGRSYLAQARLQQACDAGVLAARKRMGSEAAVSGTIPEETGDIGQRFFNVNFRDGAYGSTGRSFAMNLEEDFAISGQASVQVPTTIMRVFGFNEVPINVTCEAQINFNNTDVMMVLDVTGSMAQTNPGDSASRIEVLKDTVKGFYLQLQAASLAGTRIRYGFVPYSTNVNVGGVLEDDWVVGEWDYQSRRLKTTINSMTTFTHYTSSSYISGTSSTANDSTYSASFSETNGYYCPSKPAGDVASSSTSTSKTEVVTSPLPGVRTTVTYVRTRNGYTYGVELKDTTCQVTKTTYTNYKDTYDKITEPALGSDSQWQYWQFSYDVSNWRTDGNGCIEERETYEITDYDNVDLTKALDLDIDRVPEADDPETQWRPIYPGLVFARALEWNGSGDFTTNQVNTYKEFVSPDSLGTAACPSPALRLSDLDSEEFDDYLATLKPVGSTYHDIGMIWGARLVSPTGLFAADNADVSANSPTNRNLIFLTDGETAPYDLSYSSYGLEPLDQRRWNPDSTMSLTQHVEKRFEFACAEIKKRNVTVWVIGFGVSLNPVMKDCAGAGHFFEAADAAELNATFAAIAKNMSRLRIER